MEEEPSAIFENYLRRGHVIIETLVQHPDVPNPELFRACDIVLQRAVIRFADGREDLFLRSYFYCAQDAQNFVNFVPRGGLQISFASDTIWYPLELTRAIQEPASYVVLDILTPRPLDSKQLPEPFQIQKTGQLNYQGATYEVARVTAKLVVRQEFRDLEVKA
ncbi:MAG: hypothetical protein ICV68_17685 [Pyrinomonadaceae bacterium]|nr:hypothetical protein [Pyrinomonadaceae bacterium]